MQLLLILIKIDSKKNLLAAPNELVEWVWRDRVEKSDKYGKLQISIKIMNFYCNQCDCRIIPQIFNIKSKNLSHKKLNSFHFFLNSFFKISITAIKKQTNCNKFIEN